MGDSFGDGNRPDGERPVHEVRLNGFDIDATSVTNADFARFVEATGYATEAEAFGYSAVFHLALRARPTDVMGPAGGTPWWLGVRGADWRHPGGLLSGIDGLDDHPVVHVTWNDAVAYCEWTGRRLPTEAEWEYASRGGLDGTRYPWGDDLLDGDGWRVNIWQGDFPVRNTTEDGFLTTAPVRTFAPNGYGLWQTVGNVWEWCADWFDPAYYVTSPREDPGGPRTGQRGSFGVARTCAMTRTATGIATRPAPRTHRSRRWGTRASAPPGYARPAISRRPSEADYAVPEQILVIVAQQPSNAPHDGP